MEKRRNGSRAFTQTETEQIVQLKRLFECFDGDAAFRTAATLNNLTSAQFDRLKEIGIAFKYDEIAFLWDHEDKLYRYRQIASENNEAQALDIQEFVDSYPLLRLWREYVKQESSCVLPFTNSTDPGAPKSLTEKFSAWRSRRLASAKSELGYFGIFPRYPAFAFELSAGCSVGCWFCAFSAPKLAKVLDYPVRRDFVRHIITHCLDLFGPELTSWALPYCRTEPYDSPDYIEFLKDFEELTGAVLYTSTAASNDTDWVKRLLNHYRERKLSRLQLSVLSRDMLHKLHNEFSPLDLGDTLLEMHMPDSLRKKVTSGRIFKEQLGLKEMADHQKKQEQCIPQGTIGCVSGFLINLVSQTIQLVSPCYASKQWPYGYRVFDETRYRDEHHFPEVIQAMAERSMCLSPPPDKLLRFRDDLSFYLTKDGFDLVSPNQLHHFKGQENYGSLGGFIAAGNRTYHQASEQLWTECRRHPLIVKAVTETLFHAGFLDEVQTTPAGSKLI